ncbi:hypothetical protein PT974_08817 [Cladobotryum mycophilum]|uniref:Uncharacterized protein n=1 Tax=Cladobotryum mycophilum TaxID=491253 RepID=A0ABR0SEC9_9HYPO
MAWIKVNLVQKKTWRLLLEVRPSFCSQGVVRRCSLGTPRIIQAALNPQQ